MTDNQAPPTMTTVWVSRPQARAANLITELTKRDLAAWHYPAFIISDLEKNDPLVQFAATVNHYAALIFITAEAVVRCRHYLSPHPTPQIFAIGPSTQQQMALCGYRAANDLASTTIGDSATLLTLAALQSTAIAGKKIAVIGGRDTQQTPSPPLCAALRARGAEVLPLATYRRLPAPPLAADDDIYSLIARGALGAAVAYSSDTAQQMLTISAPNNDWLRQLPLFVIHPNIADAAHHMGYHHLHLAPAAAAGMASAIAQEIFSSHR